MSSPRADLLAHYRLVRDATEAITAPLSDEDCTIQSMMEASPVLWQLAHTNWFFETMVLERHEPEFRPWDARYRDLFNSYYNSIGTQPRRDRRGTFSRPGRAEVRRWRADTDERILRLLEVGDERAAALVEIGLHHEQQHQELILTDLKHGFWCNPLEPAYLPEALPDEGSAATALRWIPFEGGEHEVGHGGSGFAYDNEGPRHRVLLAPYELASRLVTNEEFLAFLADGGYTRPELWLSEGWSRVTEEGWEAPWTWERDGSEWTRFSHHGGRVPVRPADPVAHLSYFEADAYARWAGARLPREDEWESAAAAGGDDLRGRLQEDRCFDPGPAGPGEGLRQMAGDLWEWTSSSYAAYPGFRPPADPSLSEYNAKFMCNQYVLRGGSCATPASHIRPTYRNFFPPEARWQFSGLRLARDLR